ncbi:NADH:ubiquinone reductase (Na(+)-transporting) subunit E [Simkania negevensis]|uniref:NADH:ubiquinone reductase (Na(+)-transporting) subunit E n=1 Tax=Simkania negevensis TaxID=83561 RepID=A0ABS3AQT7_9BACT|nr:NADH:ubiquinone reductase (Na(+)-transporting) subunit E [Simkania negevensis]
MLMGPYTVINLLGILIQAIFVQNILLATFLGMCTYLACSATLKTANGLGIAVVFVVTCSGLLNWCVHTFITGVGALSWLSFIGVDGAALNLGFLEFIIFISVIAAFVQVLEIMIEKFSPALYVALGSYLPLITVNCAILGISLFSATKDLPFIPNFVYIFASGIGWWLAIALIASIREKLTYSHIPRGLNGMGITFIMTGLISLAFMGLGGIALDQPSSKQVENYVTQQPSLEPALPEDKVL